MTSMDQDPATLETPELRRRLAGHRKEEDRISYERRLLQAKVDILRDELERRGEGTDSEVMARLTEILSQGPGGSRGARARLPASLAEAEGVSPDEADALARLPDLADEEVQGLVDRFVSEERHISERRKEMFDVIDALEAELVRRYKEGSASPPSVGDA